LTAKRVVLENETTDIGLILKIDYQKTFIGHQTIGVYVLQNSNFSHESFDTTVCCYGERPHRRPIPHASVAHKGVITELQGSVQDRNHTQVSIEVDSVGKVTNGKKPGKYQIQITTLPTGISNEDPL
jgi:hypothetical protein